MVLRYLVIQILMPEMSASGLGGDTESEPRSSCRAIDLGNLPFEQQAPIALCDDHILIRPLQDRVLNRSSARIAQIQNAEFHAVTLTRLNFRAGWNPSLFLPYWEQSRKA